MIVPISHCVWQILRTVVRAESAGGLLPTGKDLRVTPSRKTKDGTFLDELVECGLLAVAEKPGRVPATASLAEKAEPEQFRARYRLTEKGRYAAEYGEYD